MRPKDSDGNSLDDCGNDVATTPCDGALVGDVPAGAADDKRAEALRGEALKEGKEAVDEARADPAAANAVSPEPSCASLLGRTDGEMIVCSKPRRRNSAPAVQLPLATPPLPALLAPPTLPATSPPSPASSCLAWRLPSSRCCLASVCFFFLEIVAKPVRSACISGPRVTGLDLQVHTDIAQVAV